MPRTNLYDWAMSQKLAVNGFKWVEDLSEFNEDFLKGYNAKSDEGYFLEVDVQCFENLHKLHNALPGLPEIKRVNKVKKHVANLHDKKEYIIHIRNLKHSLNHGFENNSQVVKFNQKTWLKSYIDMNTELRKKNKK